MMDPASSVILVGINGVLRKKLCYVDKTQGYSAMRTDHFSFLVQY